MSIAMLKASVKASSASANYFFAGSCEENSDINEPAKLLQA